MHHSITCTGLLVETRCPLCRSGGWSLHAWAPSHYGPEVMRVTRCHDCGMIYTNPQPTDYEQEVRGRGTRPQHFDSSFVQKARRTASLQLETLERVVEGRRILDFGCGNGAFVKEALDRGWDAVGVDLNAGLVEAANEYWEFGALCSAALDDFVEEQAASFDAIISNQVFEHLHDPSATGAVLLEALKPGGVVYIDVPNAAQPTEWIQRGTTLDPTSHWNHFTLETLTSLIQRLGCKVVYASAAPSLIELYHRVAPRRLCLALARLTRRVLPPIGTGVCVIGRKPVARKAATCAR